MRWLPLGILLCALVAPALSFAVTPDEMLKDPAQEARARRLSQELRCMVCQNQSIDDSEAPLAHDLRVLVRQRIEAGDTDRQVLNFLVARYGEFVLLRPRFEWRTLLLWALPPAVLLIGGAGLLLQARRRTRANVPPAALSSEEQRRLAGLIEDQPR